MEETIGEMLQRLWPEEKEAVRAAPSILASTAERPTKAANSNLSWRFAQALAGGMGPGPAGWGHAYQAGWRPSRDDPATRFILGFTPPGAAMDLYEDGRDAKQAFEEGRPGAAAWHTGNAALDAAGLIPGLALATKAVRGVGKLVSERVVVVIDAGSRRRRCAALASWPVLPKRLRTHTRWRSATR